ncbi:MAG: hypothetical protein R3234_10395, partial [Thermoanaerobaculia bacterium]|nr:hypothetical protein [Thermoanaerobaculia bacterium]
VHATYFFTTTAFDTGWIRQLYDTTSRGIIQQALDAGHHLGSHSFSHFPDFYWSIPLGESATAESYFPQYSWYVDETFGVSIVGELGVSRWLLEQDFGIPVDSFRSGYLLRPFDFEQGLTLTGYRRDTSFAGGPARGAFPFRLWDDDELGNVTTFPVLEYPMTLDDTGLDQTLTVVDAWEEVLRANYANNAPTVLLVHPTPDLEGVDAIHELLSRIGDLDLWIGDLGTFGEHWEAQGTTCSRWP